MGTPLSREQRLKKFHCCARSALARRTADRVVELVEQLAALGDVRELMDIVSHATGP